jgi:nucleoside-diphosphate-sugar epimerase
MDGPEQLLAIPNEKDGAQVLFLINHTGERVEGLPELWPRIGRQFSYVPDVPEVNIRWSLAGPEAPGRVWNVMTGEELATTTDDGYVEMRLENIGQYAIVAAEG